MTALEFITRYDNGDTFTENELQDIYWGDFEGDIGSEEIDEEIGEKRRWSQYITKIILVCGRYFSVTADIGLTEYQDNTYDIQPEEVRPAEKVVTITEWVSV